jgi:MYXO-CTERM domain-containing protein
VSSAAGVGGSGSGAGGSGTAGSGNDSGALHGSCGCRVGGDEERDGSAGLIVAALGLLAVGRRRGPGSVQHR